MSSSVEVPAKLYFNGLTDSGLIADKSDSAFKYIILQNDELHGRLQMVEKRYRQLQYDKQELEDDNSRLSRRGSTVIGYLKDLHELNNMYRDFVQCGDLTRSWSHNSWMYDALLLLSGTPFITLWIAVGFSLVSGITVSCMLLMTTYYRYRYRYRGQSDLPKIIREKRLAIEDLNRNISLVDNLMADLA